MTFSITVYKYLIFASIVLLALAAIAMHWLSYRQNKNGDEDK